MWRKNFCLISPYFIVLSFSDNNLDPDILENTGDISDVEPAAEADSLNPDDCAIRKSPSKPKIAQIGKFPCDFCCKVFRLKSSLDKHKARQHSKLLKSQRTNRKGIKIKAKKLC